MTHDPSTPNDRFSRDLERLTSPPGRAPDHAPEIDVVRARPWRLAGAVALVAAAVALVVWIRPGPQPSPPAATFAQHVAMDINGDGRVTITDALALARAVESPDVAAPSSWDVDEDGVVTRADSHFLAAALPAVVLGALPDEPGVGAERPLASGFAVYDVYVNADAPVAAWQLDIRAEHALFASVEGGETPWGEPPVARIAAGDERLILASFTVRDAAAGPRVRVARLHVMTIGDEPPTFAAEVIDAAGADQDNLDITVSIQQGADT